MLLGLVAALGGGCGSTHLTVYVRDGASRPVSGASVLFYDRPDDPCSRGASGGQLTDARGAAYVQARYCGDVKLYAAAPGYAVASRRLDSCSERSMSLVLHALPSDGEGEAVAAARAFARALLARDRAGLAGLLAQPETAELYASGGMLEHGQPYAQVVRAVEGQPAQVDVDLYFLSGCHSAFRAQLLAREGGWRVLELAPRE